MTFADAVNALRDGYAAKRPMWGGYAFKTVTSESGAAVETFKLTFRERADVDGNPVDYEYSFDGTSWTATATKLPFDADIIAAMVGDDWIIGKKEDYEAARGGSGKW